jgi:hypothetical protein
VSVFEGSADAAAALGSGVARGAEMESDWSMLREVGQSCYLMALMAASLTIFLGLGLLAVWLLG